MYYLTPMKLPTDAPLTDEQKKLLDELLPKISKAEEAGWLAQFLMNEANNMAQAAAGGGGPKVPLTILFGTESGNAEGLAGDCEKKAKKLGFAPKVVDLADIEPADLENYENVVLFISTWGEGDPPERVEGFDKAFKTASVDLGKMKFGICALGDTSYVDFCEMGKIYDARFAELGAEKVFDRIDLDVDYEDGAAEWIDSTLSKYVEITGAKPSAAAASFSFAAVEAKTYSPKEPFMAELSEKVILNGTGSKKETWHFEISLEGSGMKYEVGDALGVVPENDNDLVQALMEKLGFSGGDVVTKLRTEYDITDLTKPVMEKYAELTGNAKLKEILEGDWQDYIWGRDILDLVTEFPHDVSADDLFGILRKLPPRLYSIASSQKEVGEQVDLTVAAVRYDSLDRSRKGVASCYLADAVEKGKKLGIYLKPNKNFRLPEDSSKPVIMVGPGTGVAPFRAFLQERDASGASGKNWLFFGDQHYNYDFLYQLEVQDYIKSGTLTNLDVAFSRDTPNKVYVQHKMLEKKAEILEWLNQGAYFYVCGDEKFMAKDVDAALKEIAGEEFVEQMKKEKRYLRDVY